MRKNIYRSIRNRILLLPLWLHYNAWLRKNPDLKTGRAGHFTADGGLILGDTGRSILVKFPDRKLRKCVGRRMRSQQKTKQRNDNYGTWTTAELARLEEEISLDLGAQW